MHNLLSVALFVSSSIFACMVQAAHLKNEGSVCGSVRFFDFEDVDEDSHYEEWDKRAKQSGYVETYYRYKTPNKLGAILIGHYQESVPLGYGKFEVIKSGNMTVVYTCPSCKSKTLLDACAFNNCFFRIVGVKKKSGWTLTSRWEEVGDKLIVFKNKKKLAEWSDLTLECRPLTDPPPQDGL